MCAPTYILRTVCGDVQREKLRLPSSLHSNVEPGSLDLNAKVALCFVVVFGGRLVMVVWGGVTSVGALMVRLQPPASTPPSPVFSSRMNSFHVPLAALPSNAESVTGQGPGGAGGPNASGLAPPQVH